MKKLILLLALTTLKSYSQKASDFFNPSTKVTWLGIDFSHVKLIGDFSEFAEFGNKDQSQLRDKYFYGWNTLVVNEPEKYDIRKAIRKNDVEKDIAMIMDINSKAKLEGMKTYKQPNYTYIDILTFIKDYTFIDKQGIGILFIAEYLNKDAKQACFHFVVLDMATKDVYIDETLIEEPKGFGIKNYWAGAINEAIKDIYYHRWKKWEKKNREL